MKWKLDETRVAAVRHLIDQIKTGAWNLGPRNPATGERHMGPEMVFDDGGRAFAFRQGDGKIHWYVYAANGQQLSKGSEDTSL